MGFQLQLSDLGLAISAALMLLGVRVLRGAARSRGVPELLVGLYLLLSPPATSLLMRVDRFAPEAQPALAATASGGLALSAVCLCAFAWQAFRPRSARARAAVAGAALLFAGLWTQMLVGALPLQSEVRSLANRVAMLAVYGWVFVECVLHWRMLRRRLRLGLGDPVVANRFLLFAAWSGVLGVLPGLTLLVAYLLDRSSESPYGGFFATVVRLTGVTIYVAIWLSFLPPRAYTDWIRRRHEARPAAA